MLFAFLSLTLAADPGTKIENDSVRVLLAVDQPHKPGSLHKHDVNRVMIYLNDGDLTVRYKDGKVDEQHWKAGQVAWSPAGGMHTSENVGTQPLRIMEIELKKRGPGAPARHSELDPVKIDAKHNVLLFENSQVRVFRSWREAGGTEKMHEHAGAGRVGVFLTDLNGSVKTSEGSISQLALKAGDATWSGPVIHATTVQNRMEMIVVEVF